MSPLQQYWCHQYWLNCLLIVQCLLDSYTTPMLFARSEHVSMFHLCMYCTDLESNIPEVVMLHNIRNAFLLHFILNSKTENHFKLKINVCPKTSLKEQQGLEELLFLMQYIFTTSDCSIRKYWSVYNAYALEQLLCLSFFLANTLTILNNQKHLVLLFFPILSHSNRKIMVYHKRPQIIAVFNYNQHDTQVLSFCMYLHLVINCNIFFIR